MSSFDAKAALRISEIFCSIQGESTYSGERTSFIRTTGCPLRCTYCDTKYAYTGGKSQTIEDILFEIRPHKTKYVCVTGGEPLAQKNTLHLLHALRETGKKVSIETDGEEDISRFVGLGKLIMDIKTPESGEKAAQCFHNLKHLLPSDEIKFVICSDGDYLWAKDICNFYDLPNRFTVLFSPSHGTVSLDAIAEWILRDQLDVRLQSQLHKTIWGALRQGC